jgi:diguanylate cyclase (GGDEF)-like protein/PAS domain S-box-containing protein
MTAQSGTLAAEPRIGEDDERIAATPFSRPLVVAVVAQLVCVVGGTLRIGGPEAPWGQLQLTVAALFGVWLLERGRRAAEHEVDSRFRASMTAAGVAWLFLQVAALGEQAAATQLPLFVHRVLMGAVLVSVAVGWHRAMAGRFTRGERAAVVLDSLAVFFTIAAAVMLVLGPVAQTAPGASLLLSYAIFFIGLVAATLVLCLALVPARRLGGWLPILVGLPLIGGGFTWRLVADAGAAWHQADLFAAAGMMLSAYGAATWISDPDPSERYRDMAHRVRAIVPAVIVGAAPVLLIVNEVFLDLHGVAIGLNVDIALAIVMVVYVLRQTILLGERSRIVREAEAATARERALVADLQASEQRFRSLVQNSSDVFLILKPDGTVAYQSEAVERVLGYPPGERLGRQIFELTHPDDLGFVQVAMRELATTPGAQRTIELRTKHADGSWRHLEATGTNMIDDPVIGGVVVNYRDVTPRKQLERQLIHEALHDPLTGLANRALFGDRVSHALARRNESDELAVLLMDLDDFKTLNDSLGHAAGDQALVAVSERLRACLRPEDTIARLGGDEFVVLLEQADPGIVGGLAGSLLEALHVPFQIDAKQVHLEASIGVAFANGEIRDPGELLRNADVAMYTAKQRGKGRVELFERSMHAAVLTRLELKADIERAVERGEFRLRYQPIFDLASGGLNSFEALLRWQHPERGEVSPADFIPLAEETGLIVPIGHWVLEQACREARGWSDAGRPDLSVCVNLSARQLREPGLVASVADVLERTGLPADRLVLELTESSLMQDDEGRLHEVRALGVRIAIDDFGTGYSSLSYLSRFPIEILKIDQSFTALLGREGEENVLVRSVVQLASAMNMTTVAEGIEQPEQLALLEALGCTHGQGYLLARPMHPDDATALVVSGGDMRELAAAS